MPRDKEKQFGNKIIGPPKSDHDVVSEAPFFPELLPTETPMAPGAAVRIYPFITSARA